MIYKIYNKWSELFPTFVSLLLFFFFSCLFFSFLFRRRPNVASTSTLLSVSQKIHTPRALPPAQCLPVPPLIVVPDVQNGKKKWSFNLFIFFIFIKKKKFVVFWWYFLFPTFRILCHQQSLIFTIFFSNILIYYHDDYYNYCYCYW